MDLMKASNQWSSRPADETFWGLDDAQVAALAMKNAAREAKDVPYDALHVEAIDGELALVGQSGKPAFPTFSATGQLCARARFPHSVAARQPAQLAADNINWGLGERLKARSGDENGDSCVLLLHKGDERLGLRAMTSEKYERLWHSDLLARTRSMLGSGWRVPPARPSPSRCADPRIRPATEDDIRGIEGLTSIGVGDTIGPAGAYVSDKDMFVFVVNKNAIDGPSGGLSRFAFLFNNEIGTGSWGFTFGYFDHVCGNHIVWGAQGVKEIRVRHVGEGSFEDGVGKVVCELREYADSAASLDEAGLKRAATLELGATRDEVVEAVFEFARKKRVGELSEKRIKAAYDRAVEADRYGAPNTPWAISSGLTELSQETAFANERLGLDRAAGRVLEMAF